MGFLKKIKKVGKFANPTSWGIDKFGDKIKADRAGYRKDKRAIASGYDRMRERTNRYYEIAHGYNKQALDAGMGGFDAARREISLAGRGAMQGINDQTLQGFGGLEQSLTSRGLTGSSAAVNLQRGLMADSGRQMNDLQGTLAEQYAQNAQQAGLFQAQGLGQIGQGYLSQMGAQNTIDEDQLAYKQGKLGTKPGGWGSLLQSAAPIAGFMMGGPGGAAAATAAGKIVG